MDLINTTKYKNLFIRFIFILSVLLYFVKTETNLHVPADYSYNPIQIRIEQVVSRKAESDLLLIKFDTSQKQKTDFSLAATDFSSIQKYSLFHFNNVVIHQLKSYNSTFNPINQISTILQKHNIWHQSTDEDPLLIS